MAASPKPIPPLHMRIGVPSTSYVAAVRGLAPGKATALKRHSIKRELIEMAEQLTPAQRHLQHTISQLIATIPEDTPQHFFLTKPMSDFLW